MENNGKNNEYSAETKKAGMGSISIGVCGFVGEVIAYIWAQSQYGNVRFRGEVIIASLIFIICGWIKHENAKKKEDALRDEIKQK